MSAALSSYELSKTLPINGFQKLIHPSQLSFQLYFLWICWSCLILVPSFMKRGGIRLYNIRAFCWGSLHYLDGKWLFLKQGHPSLPSCSPLPNRGVSGFCAFNMLGFTWPVSSHAWIFLSAKLTFTDWRAKHVLHDLSPPTTERQAHTELETCSFPWMDF